MGGGTVRQSNTSKMLALATPSIHELLVAERLVGNSQDKQLHNKSWCAMPLSTDSPLSLAEGGLFLPWKNRVLASRQVCHYSLIWKSADYLTFIITVFPSEFGFFIIILLVESILSYQTRSHRVFLPHQILHGGTGKPGRSKRGAKIQC